MNWRFPSFVYCLTLTVLFCAPSISIGELKAGASKVNINPKLGVSLDGPISKNGVVAGFNDPLHARALVFDDGVTRMAIVICDACMIEREIFDEAKEIASKTTRIKTEHMMIAATHTHAAPRLTHVGTGPLDNEYHTLVPGMIAKAIELANENLAPAAVAHASFQKPEFIKCRRHLCEPGTVSANPFGETGEKIKSVAGRSSAIIRPAGPVDPQFSILSVRHVDGSPLAILGNFSVHYCGGYRRGIVSADYFGHYGAALEASLSSGNERSPFIGIMSNGTSGNTGGIERDGKKYEMYEWMKVSARILADETLAALAGVQHDSSVSLGALERELQLGVRLPDASRVAWARKILEMDDAEKKSLHRWVNVYANETLHLSKYPANRTIKLQAFRIGQIAVASAPCEVFAETGLAIKNGSPFEKTFTIELANGYGGYLPPKEQHILGGYETWPARSSFLEVDAETRIRETLIELLGELKENQK